MILLYVLIGVYFAAANVYAFFLVRAEKHRERARGEKTGGNGRLLLADCSAERSPPMPPCSP